MKCMTRLLMQHFMIIIEIKCAIPVLQLRQHQRKITALKDHTSCIKVNTHYHFPVIDCNFFFISASVLWWAICSTHNSLGFRVFVMQFFTFTPVASEPTNFKAVQEGLTNIRLSWSPPQSLRRTNGYMIKFSGTYKWVHDQVQLYSTDIVYNNTLSSVLHPFPLLELLVNSYAT